MYNKWFSNKVATQLDQGVNSTEVEINSKLSDLKPLHASWIVDLYEHLKKKNRDGHKRFRFQGDFRKFKILFKVPKQCFLTKKRVVY